MDLELTELIVTHAPLQQAIDFAQKVFPELGHTPREHISFSVTVKGEDKSLQHVRIGPMAWGPVVAALPQFHYVDISVASPLTVPDPPPKYATSESEEYARQSHSTPSSPRLRAISDSQEKRRSWVGKFLG